MSTKQFKIVLKEKKKKIIIWSVLSLIASFVPIVQLPAIVIAYPLFLIPAIGKSSVLMGYMFGCFYPRSILTILIFAIYYLVFFTLIEYVKYKNNENIPEKQEETLDLKTIKHAENDILVVFSFIGGFFLMIFIGSWIYHFIAKFI